MSKAKSAAVLKMSPVKTMMPTRIPNPYSLSPKKNAKEKKNPTTLSLWWITMAHHTVGHLKKNNAKDFCQRPFKQEQRINLPWRIRIQGIF
jgi:hypothetical protein